jgi:hypothetical protein
MLKDALVFNGINALDFYDVRVNVIRIPEVSQRLQAAQAIWDESEEESLHLPTFLTSDNSIFQSNIRLKSLCSAIVQVGLYDRYMKRHAQPEFMVGCSNGYSAMRVCSGQMDFEELIREPNQASNEGVAPVIPINDAPVLSGIALTEYSVVERKETDQGAEYVNMNLSDMDIKKVVQSLLDEQEVKKFTNIGPGDSLLGPVQKDLAFCEVQFLESIDLDPLLSWFWTDLKKAGVDFAIAQ